MTKTVLITGGAGFIGSHFTEYLAARYPEYALRVLDVLTYAGRRENLAALENNSNFAFIHADVRDKQAVYEAMQGVDYVVHFAAETHVDRSILDPDAFITTDVYGTFVMLEAARRTGIERFVHISTDEVYGSAEQGAFTEQSPLQPSSPYAASKAGADLLAQAYYRTYGVPVLIVRPSNTFGPRQYPEKLIPFFTVRALHDQPLPLYGDGQQQRDWLYVGDHVRAIDTVLHKGQIGEAYNIAGGNERTNIEVSRIILNTLGKPESLIQFVQDRPGHDRRYALDDTKLRVLGWKPEAEFETALQETVSWYAQHPEWWQPILQQQAEYRQFVQQWYAGRETGR
ncbi:MAG: dTDP-glucose 4,6-dehydratase [Fimbriimonadales bacterium]|nr:dTDP-glucose 4,6-dehydratase [Fimbriimonadales bacterium]